ncbi:hypothetical protein DFH11DRAFT_809917 [Phellopilus nigrolimitatus]|nr:hypothetical protein DFH11DRAFT_809917 [Phellopilus nigrolimitatus]
MALDAMQASTSATSSASAASPSFPSNSQHLPPSSLTVTNTSPSNTNPPPTNAGDLRHITSIPNMAPPMKDRTVSASSDRSGRPMAAHPLMSVSASPHRLGSRSPASIPSSPTSVHSSSSAIFERDIELPPSHLAPHSHPSNPHRTPRSKATEPIDASVPSVLDSAAALLTSPINELEDAQIAIEAPAPTSALGSPVGRGSRSPSPAASAGGRAARTSMLLNLPSPVQSSIISVPLSPASVTSSGGRFGASASGSPPRAGSQANSPPPLATNFSARPASPPTSVGGSTAFESAASSPTTTTREHPSHPLPFPAVSPITPTTTNVFGSSQLTSQPSSPTRGAHVSLPTSHPHQSQLSSHPPSPAQAAHKRLSFLSYNDMLASTPVATRPLASLTSPASADPPPHIPGVEFCVGSGTNNFSSLGSGMGSVGSGVGVGSRSVSATGSMAGSARTSLVLDGVLAAAADVKEPTGGMGDDLGGEWEREGLGRGLEERLEALMAVGPGKA